jgi:hypothetical protein
MCTAPRVRSHFANGSLLLFKIMCEVCILVIVSLLHVSSVLISDIVKNTFIDNNIVDSVRLSPKA